MDFDFFEKVSGKVFVGFDNESHFFSVLMFSEMLIVFSSFFFVLV